MNRATFVIACLFTAVVAMADGHWVGTWGTAPQLVENHNNPPSPGLGNNSFRQIVQVSIGGEKVRLKLTNEFSQEATEIKAVELARATTAGSSYEIEETSTVSLTFDGKASVTMPAGGKAVSDAVSLHLDPRQNVAITIHYGEASSTSVSGHPGSRTTSYLAVGNTTDFSSAIKTDHWYNILALEVEAPEEAGAVVILGNSITDGRGSTTNQQNRWADVLSRRLLANASTAKVGVLNMGIGGNCVLGGGLGPAGVKRYPRDLFGQEGVKWIILFEAVNDLGSARDGVQTADRLIEVYKQIIREAHQKGIYVFGATVTPFKGNRYYTPDHENGRYVVNRWIRTTKMLDGVIDFDKAVRNPQDTVAMQSKFLFENDWLHLNAMGYETMGNCIDLSLFTKRGPLAADEETTTRQLKAGDVSMTIDPQKGAKVLSLKYKDKEVISQTRFPESFGSTFWTSPQKEWNWPPVSEFDKMPYEVEEKNGHLVMTSRLSDKLKYRVRKDFSIDAKNNAFVVTYTIINESDETRQVAPWEITRVPNGGMIFFDAPLKSVTPTDLLKFEARDGAVWYQADEANENRKINADGKGWLAHCTGDNGLLLVKVFDDLNAQQPAPGEAEIQVYVNRGKSFIELESQGAYATLKPQEELHWTVRWHLMPVDGSCAPSKKLVKTVKGLLKKK